jgi:IMP dehydrogenase
MEKQPYLQPHIESARAQGFALTYDDVRIETGPSEVAPSEVNIESRFSANVELKIPVISAAMDTVTEAKMAIAMAKLGGLGVIHAGLDPERQGEEVRRVKWHLNARIDKPITVYGEQTLSEVLEMCDKRDFDFRSFPVVNEENRLVGMLTQNDFDSFKGKPETTVNKAMTPAADVRSAGSKVTPQNAHALMLKHKVKTLPLLDRSKRLKGLYVRSDTERIVEGNPDKYNLDVNGRLRVAAAVPTDEEALVRVADMLEYLDVAVIDSAQGDSKYAFQTLKQLKETYPHLDVVVGNISSAKSARLLAEHGADGIKVGQGPGSICTTRIETGIGKPQVSAVYECAKALREIKKDIPICADGGINNAGDVSVAIAAGAHSIMTGSKLAPTDEAPGEVIRRKDNAPVKLYRGMGSPSAIKESAASRKRYGGSQDDMPLAEGVESYVPYQGSVNDIVDHFVKALRKSMSYVGAPDIETHRRDTEIFRITNAGLKESHPHGVEVITK